MFFNHVVLNMSCGKLEWTICQEKKRDILYETDGVVFKHVNFIHNENYINWFSCSEFVILWIWGMEGSYPWGYDILLWTWFKTNCIQLKVREMFSSFSLFVLVFVLLCVQEIMPNVELEVNDLFG